MIGQHMAAEMADQERVLAAQIARYDRDVETVAAIRPASFAGTMLLGRGSSDNAATLGRYLVEISSGRPAGLSAASIHTRYHPQSDYAGYVVVAFSQSGRTPEIVSAAERMRRAGARLVVVTNDPGSPLAALGDVPLDLNAGVEQAVPATKTVTAQMLAAITIAHGLALPGAEPVTRSHLDLLPAATAATLGDDCRAAELAYRWNGQRRLLVVARGLLYPAALETALKIRETTGVFAQGISSADLMHGPIAAVDRDLPVLLLHSPGPTNNDLKELAERLARIGADVASWGPGHDDGPRLAQALPEPLAAIIATVRGQQLALAWARAAGLDPDTPNGLSKITNTS